MITYKDQKITFPHWMFVKSTDIHHRFVVLLWINPTLRLIFLEEYDNVIESQMIFDRMEYLEYCHWRRGDNHKLEIVTWNISFWLHCCLVVKNQEILNAKTKQCNSINRQRLIWLNVIEIAELLSKAISSYVNVNNKRLPRSMINFCFIQVFIIER